MADSNFWRQLAAEFRLIPDSGRLRADGCYIVGSNAPWDWWLDGDPSEFICATFKTLAIRGASELATAGTTAGITDLLIFWLEALRQDKSGFRAMGSGSELPIGGGERVDSLLGSIPHLCETSATFCKKLEGQALQAEFEEKQRALTPAAQEAQTPARFRPLDENYQVIEFDGRQYELTPNQSTVIRVLHTAHLENRRPVGIKEIHRALGIHSGKMSEWFRRRNHELWERLILHTGKQHYRLDL